MKFSRRSVLGALFAIPLIPRGMEFRPVKSRAARSLLTLNGDSFPGSNFKTVIEQFNVPQDRYVSTAEFKAPHGRFTLGQDVNIAYNGMAMFSGVVNMIECRHTVKVKITNFTDGVTISEPTNPVEYEIIDHITAVDKLSLLPMRTYLDVMNPEQLAKSLGQEIMRGVKENRARLV